MKIAIYGGTFNPPHLGHLKLARQMQENFSLDRVLFMPSGNSYMKNGVLEKRHRYNMTKLMVSNLENISVSDYEVNKEGPSYTFETLTYFKESHPSDQLYFIMGADSLMYIENWKHPEIIFEKAVILCAFRKEYKNTNLDFKTLEMKARELENRFCGKIELMAFHEAVSSSDIRNKLMQNIDCTADLSEAVLSYIQENHLYQTL